MKIVAAKPKRVVFWLNGIFCSALILAREVVSSSVASGSCLMSLVFDAGSACGGVGELWEIALSSSVASGSSLMSAIPPVKQMKTSDITGSLFFVGTIYISSCSTTFCECVGRGEERRSEIYYI